MKRILVVAAGAVGGYYGAKLCRAGRRVVFVARGKHAEAMTARGLKIVEPEGNFTLTGADDEFEVVTRIANGGPADLVLFAVKWRDCQAAAEELAGALSPEAVVLCMLNGVDAEGVLSRALGAERVVGAMATIAARIEAPGVVRRDAFGGLTLGELDGPARARTRAIAGAFSAAGVPAEATDDLWKAKWQKLCWNATFNSLNALTRRPVGEIAFDEVLGGVARLAMREVARVAQAEGVDMSHLDEEMIDRVLEVTRQMGGAPTSMLQDLLAGRPLENEIMSGAVVRRAHAHGISVPVQETLYGLLRVIG